MLHALGRLGYSDWPVLGSLSRQRADRRRALRKCLGSHFRSPTGSLHSRGLWGCLRSARSVWNGCCTICPELGVPVGFRAALARQLRAEMVARANFLNGEARNRTKGRAGWLLMFAGAWGCRWKLRSITAVLDPQRSRKRLRYPPTVGLPPRPLPLRRFLFRFVRNPLSSLPRPAYEEPIVVTTTGATSWPGSRGRPWSRRCCCRRVRSSPRRRSRSGCSTTRWATASSPPRAPAGAGSGAPPRRCSVPPIWRASCRP